MTSELLAAPFPLTERGPVPALSLFSKDCSRVLHDRFVRILGKETGLQAGK